MDQQEHLLTCLAEEAGEIVQAVGKALRFGLQDGYPGTDRTNERDIQIEIIQLIAVAEMLEENGYMDRRELPNSFEIKKEKKKKVYEFMEYAKKAGTLND